MLKAVAAGFVAAIVLAVGFSVAVDAQRGAPPRPAAPAARTGYNGPRTADRKPDLNGIWQVLGTAHWNLEAHSAIEGVPAGFSVVEGGAIPYSRGPWRSGTRTSRTGSPTIRCRQCFMPGVPRATYLPFPFEITQTPKHIAASPTSSRTRRARSSSTARRTWRISTSGWATGAAGGKATRWSSTR